MNTTGLRARPRKHKLQSSSSYQEIFPSLAGCMQNMSNFFKVCS